MYDNRLKPTTIRHTLRKMDDIEQKDQPSKRQIKYAIDLHKKETYGKGVLTMKKISEFVSNHDKVPENENQAFIVMFNRSTPGQVENQWFRFFISTPRFLKMSAKAETLHADGTYKLIIQGYPVIIVGSSDMARKFHMIGMAV